MYSFMTSFVSGLLSQCDYVKKIMSIAEAKAWVVLMMCRFSSTVTVSASECTSYCLRQGGSTCYCGG